MLIFDSESLTYSRRSPPVLGFLDSLLINLFYLNEDFVNLGTAAFLFETVLEELTPEDL